MNKLLSNTLSISTVIALSAILGSSGNCQVRRTTSPSVQTEYKRGVSLFAQQRLDAARTAFTKVLAASPHDVPTLTYLGIIALREQQYADAVAPLEEVAHLQPASSDAHINLGNAYEGLKRYDDAKHQFTLAASLNPRSISALYNLGGVYYATKQFAQAVSTYRKAALLAPNDTDVLNNLAVALQAAGNLSAAIPVYQKTAAIEPTNSTYQMNTALALQLLAKKSAQGSGSNRTASLWRMATSSMQAAVKDAPSNYRLRETYAEMLAQAGNNAAAIKQFNMASAQEPMAFRPYYQLAMLQTKLANYKSAEGAARHALTIRPQDAAVLKLLGFTEFKLGRFDPAVHYYKAAAKVAPRDLTVWENLGAAMQAAGNIEDVLLTITQLTKQNSPPASLAPLHRAAGYLYLTKGDPESLKLAIDNYRLASQEDDTSSEAYNGLGLAYQKTGSVSAALSAFQRAVALNPRWSDAYNNLGVVYEAQGHLKLAAAAFKKALTIDKYNQLAKTNLARLKGTH